MELLQQAAAMMIVGMAIVFGMLAALIGVTVANARVVRQFNLEPPPPKKPRPAGATPGAPIVAIIAAAIDAHESY